MPTGLVQSLPLQLVPMWISQRKRGPMLGCYSHGELFRLALENIELCLHSLDGRQTLLQEMLENPSASRNIRRIVFHRGISVHFCECHESAGGTSPHCSLRPRIRVALAVAQLHSCVRGATWRHFHANPGMQASLSRR